MDKVMTQEVYGQDHKNEQHIAYFDYLRVFSMLAVVIMHASAGSLRNGLGSSWYILNIIVSFCFIAVPLFFMISGCVILKSNNTHSIKYLLTKRIPKLLLPLISWSVISIVIRYLTPGALVDGFNFKQCIREIALIPSRHVAVHLWFMYVLIPIYLISPFLKSIVEQLKKAEIIYLFILWGCIALLRTINSFLPDFLTEYTTIRFFTAIDFLGGNLGYIFLGYYLHMRKKKGKSGIYLICAIVMTGIIAVGTYVFTKRTGQYNQVFQEISSVFIICLSIAVFLYAKERISTKEPPAIISFLSSISFGIYLVHNIFLSVLNMYFGINPIGLKMTLYVFILTVIVCILLIVTIATIRPLCFLLTGVSYKKACNTCNWIFIAKQIKGMRRKNERKTNIY